MDVLGSQTPPRNGHLRQCWYHALEALTSCGTVKGGGGQLSWNLNDNILKCYHAWSTKIWSLNVLFLCLERDIRGLFHKIDFLEKTLLKFFVENSTQMKNLFYGTASDFEVEVFQKTSTPSLGFPENLNLALNEAKVFQKTQQRFFFKKPHWSFF